MRHPKRYNGLRSQKQLPPSARRRTFLRRSAHRVEATPTAAISGKLEMASGRRLRSVRMRLEFRGGQLYARVVARNLADHAVGALLAPTPSLCEPTRAGLMLQPDRETCPGLYRSMRMISPGLSRRNWCAPTTGFNGGIGKSMMWPVRPRPIGVG